VNVNEIKSWAKGRGFVVKKSGDGYVWSGEGVYEGDPAPIEAVAKSIFNRITGDKFVDHQRSYSNGPTK
jgi:hypothetical protein